MREPCPMCGQFEGIQLPAAILGAGLAVSLAIFGSAVIWGLLRVGHSLFG